MRYYHPEQYTIIMKNQSLKYIIYIIGLLILILGPLYAFTKDDVLSSYDLSNHKFNYSRPCKQLYWKYEEMIAIRNNLGENHIRLLMKNYFLQLIYILSSLICP